MPVLGYGFALMVAALFAAVLWGYIEHKNIQILTAENSTLIASNQRCLADVQTQNKAVQDLQDEAGKRSRSAQAALAALQIRLDTQKPEKTRLQAAFKAPAPQDGCVAALKVIRGQK